MKNDIEIGTLFKQRYLLDAILQRSYEWEENKVINLINDIVSIKFKGSRGGNCRYNIGDFITYKKNELDDCKYICDGQQRLTTLVLLFSNILHHYPSDQTYQKIIGGIKRNLYKCDLDQYGYEKEFKVIKLKDTDNIILEKIIESGIDGLTKEEKKSHLAKIYKRISKEFTDNKTEKELNELYSSIFQNASYFERECESQEEAIKQFVNLNGGQQNLSKSRIELSKLYGIYNKQPFDEEIEKLLYTLSNMETKKAKELLLSYVYFKDYPHNEYNLSSSVDSIVKMYENDSKILDDLKNFYYGFYLKEIENNNNNFMKTQSSLREIWVDLYSDKYSHMKDVNDNEKNSVYKMFEWGCICNKIKNGGNGENYLFNGFIKNFNNKNGALSDYVITKLKEKGLYESVYVINEHKVSNKNFYIYLLSIIEEEYQKEMGSKELFKPCSKVTLEHVHPQKPRKDEQYECDDTRTNRFGNMTIIGAEVNQAMSNKNYTKKKSSYSNSPYWINSKHLCKYEHWTNETVEDNERFYFKMLSKHYGFDFPQK